MPWSTSCCVVLAAADVIAIPSWNRPRLARLMEFRLGSWRKGVARIVSDWLDPNSSVQKKWITCVMHWRWRPSEKWRSMRALQALCLLLIALLGLAKLIALAVTLRDFVAASLNIFIRRGNLFIMKAEKIIGLNPLPPPSPHLLRTILFLFATPSSSQLALI